MSSASINENETQMTEEEMFGMLQRMKKENKELRKSRNSLQSDHTLLSKIEGKLRYKLEILMKKLSHLQYELPPNIQKRMSGGGGSSIEETIDALIEHVTWVSDRYITLENELKSSREQKGNSIQNLCQDLKQFALEHELLRKNALKDEEWMPDVTKNSNESENQSHSWQVLFKHMSNELGADKKQRKEALEWIKTNVNNYGDNNNDNFMDCMMCAMKNMQNEQMELQSANKIMEKQTQKISDELKEVRNSLQKEDQSYEKNKEQMESVMTVLHREKQEIEDKLKQTQNEQMQLQSANKIIEKEKQEMSDELKEMRNSLSKEEQNNEKNKKQLEEMESRMNVLQREKLEMADALKQTQTQLEMSESKMNATMKEYEDAMQKLRTENDKLKNDMKEAQVMNEELKNQINNLTVENKKKKSKPVKSLVMRKTNLKKSYCC